MQAGITRKIRRALYIVSVIPALASAVTGTLGEKNNHMLVSVAIPYSLWLALFGAFVSSAFMAASKTSKFVLVCIWHLSCVAMVLFFFSSLHTGSTNNIFFWIPIGTQIGILVAFGLQEFFEECLQKCASIDPWIITRGLVLSLLDGLRVLMGAEDARLPQYEHSRHDSSLYSSTGTLDGPGWNVLRGLPPSTTAFRAAYQHNDLMPDDDLNANPWRLQ